MNWSFACGLGTDGIDDEGKRIGMKDKIEDEEWAEIQS